MNSLIKKTELVANVAIIVVAILLAVVLVRSFLYSGSQRQLQAPASTIKSGTQLTIPGIEWKANGRTLVMALSTKCRFCTESAPFYQRLAQERVRNSNLRLVAVFSESAEEGQAYLKDLAVTVDGVRHSQLESLGITGTPTLIMANDHGVVEDSWHGKLTADGEAQVLNRLK